MTIADHRFPSPSHDQSADAVPAGVLDVADGIARVMGDGALYARILRRFRDDYQDGVLRIGAALDSGDLRLAHRMAHTLKGAAGMIGAHAVHGQASVLELALRNAMPGQGVPIAAIGAALEQVLHAIGLQLAAQPARVQPPAGPAHALAPGPTLVARLAALLAIGDGAAVDLLEESGACLKAELGGAGFSAVAFAVNEFNFEGALEALGRIAEAQRTLMGS